MGSNHKRSQKRNRCPNSQPSIRSNQASARPLIARKNIPAGIHAGFQTHPATSNIHGIQATSSRKLPNSHIPCPGKADNLLAQRFRCCHNCFQFGKACVDTIASGLATIPPR